MKIHIRVATRFAILLYKRQFLSILPEGMKVHAPTCVLVHLHHLRNTVNIRTCLDVDILCFVYFTVKRHGHKHVSDFVSYIFKIRVCVSMGRQSLNLSLHKVKPFHIAVSSRAALIENCFVKRSCSAAKWHMKRRSVMYFVQYPRAYVQERTRSKDGQCSL